MTCYELATIIISALSAVGTIMASCVAIWLARHPDRLKLNVWIDDKNDTCTIINRSTSVTTISSIEIICKKYWLELIACNNSEKISFPYEIKSGNILKIDFFLRSIYEILPTNKLSDRSRIYAYIFDAFGRKKKVFIAKKRDLLKALRTNTIINKDFIHKVQSKLSKDECSVLSIIKNDNYIQKTPLGTVNSTAILLNRYNIKVNDFEKLKSNISVKEIPYQTKIDEYVVVFHNKPTLSFYGDNSLINEELNAISISTETYKLR